MALLLAAIIVPLVLLILLMQSYASRSSEYRDYARQPLDNDSVERYDALLWLLADERLQLLRSRGALEREKRIRIRRHRIVRSRLESLRGDFSRVSIALKILLVHSPGDRPDLASRLIRAQVEFTYHVLVLRLRLWRYAWGLGQ